MQDYTRGDVEFLAMEMFHRDHGDNRSWFSWDGEPSKLHYRLQARLQLEEPVEALPYPKGSVITIVAAPEEKPKKRVTKSRDSAVD